MTQRKKSLAVLAAIAFLIPVGCQTYTPYSYGGHWENRVHKWGGDFMKIGKSFDRHFLNYDWDDPRFD